jgi:hypothetical protein
MVSAELPLVPDGVGHTPDDEDESPDQRDLEEAHSEADAHVLDLTDEVPGPDPVFGDEPPAPVPPEYEQTHELDLARSSQGIPTQEADLEEFRMDFDLNTSKASLVWKMRELFGNKLITIALALLITSLGVGLLARLAPEQSSLVVRCWPGLCGMLILLAWLDRQPPRTP